MIVWTLEFWSCLKLNASRYVGTDVKLHPNWKVGSSSDVALLKVSPAVIFEPNMISPICLDGDIKQEIGRLSANSISTVFQSTDSSRCQTSNVLPNVIRCKTKFFQCKTKTFLA